MFDKKAWHRNWRSTHRERSREIQTKYYRKHQKEINAKNLLRSRGYYNKCLAEWSAVIPKETKCEICGVAIYLNIKNNSKVIHFDHRNGGEEIIRIAPSVWLGRHRCTKKNIDIWESCKFGTLCNSCNHFLPTKNRENFLKKALEYANKKG